MLMPCLEIFGKSLQRYVFYFFGISLKKHINYGGMSDCFIVHEYDYQIII